MDCSGRFRPIFITVCRGGMILHVALVIHGVSAASYSSRLMRTVGFRQALPCSPHAPRLLLPSLRAGRASLVVPLAFGSDPVVPGTGVKIAKVGDDFEDPDWEYYFRGHKSSQEMDDEPRLPTGEAKNRRWYEGIKRGHPDVVRRVPTPPGGLAGSQGALLLQSLRTGIPGRITNRMQQDDFVADVNYRLGGVIPVSQCPSVVVRVFLPPVDEWENRTGPHFAFRCAAETYKDGEPETYLARHVHRVRKPRGHRTATRTMPTSASAPTARARTTRAGRSPKPAGGRSACR